MTGRITKKAITSFILDISKEYDLDINELNSRLEKTLAISAPVKKSVKEDPPMKDDNVKHSELTAEILEPLKVAELKELCKSRKLPVSGKKQDLKNRLLGIQSTTAKKSKGLKTRVTVKDIKKEKSMKIIDKISKHQPTFNIRKSKAGNLIKEIDGEYFIFSEHKDNQDTRRVIGVELENGEKRNLTPQDIEKCLQYGLEYILPDNLGAGQDDVSIDELDGEQDGVNEEELEDIEEEKIVDKDSISEESSNESEGE
jgi:hypothetical protein